MKPLVMKFGGTSVGSPEAVQRSVQLVAAQAGSCDGIVVVVSALSGVTNLLIDCAVQAAHASDDQVETGIQAYYDRHTQLIKALQFDRKEEKDLLFSLEQRTGQLRSILASIQLAGHLIPQLQDAAASLGERMSTQILAALLRHNGFPTCEIDASQLIVTNASFTQAAVQFDATNRNILARLTPLLEKGIIPVVTGFIGAAPSGQVTTLGRGASDYSSTILAAALNACEIWNWTDVDGVFNADPRLVPQAKVFSVLSYETMSILSKYGAKVLHPETLRPVSRLGIPVRVRNSFHPDKPGTLIQSNQPIYSSTPLAVVSKTDLILLEKENAASCDAECPSAYKLESSDHQFQICYAIPAEKIDEFSSLNGSDYVRKTHNTSLISVIGGRLDTNKVVSILTAAGLAVLASRLHSSDGSALVIVRSEDTVLAVQVLYNCLVEKAPDSQELKVFANAWLDLSEFNAVQK
jgi:bifunctional aspartokinase / homoserine dehydrogenase 1